MMLIRYGTVTMRIAELASALLMKVVWQDVTGSLMKAVKSIDDTGRKKYRYGVMKQTYWYIFSGRKICWGCSRCPKNSIPTLKIRCLLETFG